MYGIVANVLSDRVLRTGSKVWICDVNGDAEHPIVMGLNKSGRWVEKYTAFKRLTNYRAAWIPEHLREQVLRKWEERAEAAKVSVHLSEMWIGIRFCARDGQLRRDGEPARAAFDRARKRWELERSTQIE